MPDASDNWCHASAEKANNTQQFFAIVSALSGLEVIKLLKSGV